MTQGLCVQIFKFTEFVFLFYLKFNNLFFVPVYMLMCDTIFKARHGNLFDILG